jgi:TctA family transporter
MVQLYFLSVLCNGLTGYLLFTDDNGGDKLVERDPASILFRNPTFLLVLGILSGIIGVLVLLSPYNGIPILGDLIPSVAGIMGAFVIIFGIYRRDSSSLNEDSKLERFGESLLRIRKIIGLAIMIVALLHFLFPQALFL